jgi:hypothetical protein
VTSAGPSIIEFATDSQLLGLSLSPAQRTLLRAIYGLGAEDLALWREFGLLSMRIA